MEKQMKWIESHEGEKAQLDIFECKCGFHLGLDATYLDQIGNIALLCPSCSEWLDTARAQMP